MAAPPSEVWYVVADVENARRWNPAWSRIEITSAQRHGLGMTFRAHVEGDEAYDFEVVDWSRHKRIAFAPIRSAGEDYAINLESHIFDLRGAGEGVTNVTLTAVANTRGLKGRFIGLFFWPGYQKQGLNEALELIAAIVEPEPEPEGEQAEHAPAD
jgi:hypothetical protein